MDLQLIDQSYHISLCREIIQNSQEDSQHNGVLFGGSALPNRSAENTTRRLSLGPSVVAALATLNIASQPSRHHHWQSHYCLHGPLALGRYSS
ncbi:hypothetical protein CY34DRAFT_800767 [Suillus luteus UH-Slu-Lm8-n1]|uniref:Uncharacterized protein n=1 Tax=Suillus luteus UH-Slu-Lm8-n1 TaxID=930992 RepID=A0A0D0BJJ1_9AGAM|nr:hypothetical protein CY34DRAFT_800767 [Suillus luteus UH-Slu-Lm8-n1]